MSAETTARPAGGNGHMPAGTPPRTPSRRSAHFSYATWEYSTEIGYEELSSLISDLYDLWDSTEKLDCPHSLSDGFEALINRLADMREWTGWDGVPAAYTGTVSR